MFSLFIDTKKPRRSVQIVHESMVDDIEMKMENTIFIGKKLQEVGRGLYATRRKKGLSLQTVADILHIHRRYLEELETGELIEIQGKAYYLQYLKEYASFLGMDEKKIADMVMQETLQDNGTHPSQQKYRHS